MAGKKTGKRLLTWVLVLVMALSLLPLNALAAQTGYQKVTIKLKYSDWNYEKTGSRGFTYVYSDPRNGGSGWIYTLLDYTQYTTSAEREGYTFGGYEVMEHGKRVSKMPGNTWDLGRGNGGQLHIILNKNAPTNAKVRLDTVVTGGPGSATGQEVSVETGNACQLADKVIKSWFDDTNYTYKFDGYSKPYISNGPKGTLEYPKIESMGKYTPTDNSAVHVLKANYTATPKVVAPSAPSKSDVISILKNVTINCTNQNVKHDSQSYPLTETAITNISAVNGNDPYTCTVTINSQKYVEQFDSDTGAVHTPKDTTATVTLEYKNNAWYVKNGTSIVFNVVCDATPDDPELGANFKYEKNIVDVICETTGTHNDSYGLKNGYYTVSDKKQLTNGNWKCTITIDLAKYFDFYKSQHSGHTRDTQHPDATSIMTIYPTWYARSRQWSCAESLIDAAEIYVKCDATPTEPSKEDVKKLLGDNAVQIICTNDKATHTPKSKGYALIEDSYTSDGVKGDAENGYTYTVTIKSEKYVNQFDTDTGAVHTPKNATATVTLEYKNNAWLVKSGTPISFNVVCDAAPTYPVYVYAFFAHDNTPLKGDVTVNDNKIEWNEDANNKYKEYFVTLGVYPNGTTKEPIADATGLDLEALKVTEYEAATSAGSGKANGVALNDITSFPSPYGKVCKGAAGYPEIEDKLSWHLDSQVDVYTVTYNNDGTAQGTPTSNGYYFGSYTIAAAPKRDGYTFTGWKDSDGTVYDAGSKINKLSKDLNLVAQWTVRTDLSYTVNHLWGNESIGSTTGEAEYGYTITPSTSFDGYTLISGQTTTYTITEDGRVFNLYYYKNVTLTANSDTKTYDGTEHTVTGYTAKDNKDNLVEGLTFTGVDSPSVSGTDVGEYDVEFSGSAVGAHNNLYYVTAANPGKLTITPRKVTLTSASASKVYDGTPLTRPNVKVTGDGFADGEGATYNVTGTITNVGTVDNAFTYTLKDGTKASNYNIIKTEGKLTITEASAPTPGTFDFNDVVYGDGKVTPAITKTVKGNVGKNFMEAFYVTVKGADEKSAATMSAASYTGKAEVIASKSLKDVPFLFKPEAMAKAVVPYGKLRFTEAGTYTYTVQEVPGGTSRMSYDTTEYTLTINVVLDEDSNTYQVKSWQFTPGNREYPDALNIVNTYRTYHPSTPSKPTLNTGDHYAYVMGYPDGTVRPNGSITRAEVSAILFRLLSDKTRDEYFTTESSFTDVKAGAWYNNSIATLEKAGVIVDTAKGGAFRPNEAITRAELAAMLAQFSDAKPVKGVKFSDVSAEHWAYEAIAIAAKMGWIEGYPDGTFRPDATITRAEMMTLVNRALERVPSDEDHLLSKRVMLTFPDCKSGDWFYIAVQEATNSHTYERAATEKNGDEQWTALRANRDWTLLEK